jgi:hypothetical protein
MDAPSLVSAWDALVQQLCYVFTEPTARTWRQIALGWVLHRGPATVTAIFRTLGNVADRHWTVYEKFFYRAAWGLSTLGTALLVYPLLLEATQGQAGEVVADLAIDDTTADPQQLVIAPVEVLVNGKSSQVLYAGGYPGAVDGYQVNFQVPDTTAPGTASVQVTSAWIPSPEVKLVIQ